MHLLPPRLVRSRIGGSLRIFLFLQALVSVVGFLLTFQYLLALVLMGGRPRSLAPLFLSLCGLLAGKTLLIGPPLRYLVLFRMPGMCIRMSSGLYLLMLYLLSGMRFPGLLSMIFGPSGAKVRRGRSATYS